MSVHSLTSKIILVAGASSGRRHVYPFTKLIILMTVEHVYNYVHACMLYCYRNEYFAGYYYNFIIVAHTGSKEYFLPH